MLVVEFVRVDRSLHSLYEHLYTVTVANAAKSIDKLLSGPGSAVF